MFHLKLILSAFLSAFLTDILISYEDFNRLLLLQRSFISLSMGKKLFLMCDGKQSSE